MYKVSLAIELHRINLKAESDVFLASGQLVRHHFGIPLGSANLLQWREGCAGRRSNDAVRLCVSDEFADSALYLWLTEVPMVTSGWILGGKVQTPSWLQVSRHCFLAHSGLRVYLAHVGALALEQCHCILQCDFNSDVVSGSQLSSKHLVCCIIDDTIVHHFAGGQAPNSA